MQRAFAQNSEPSENPVRRRPAIRRCFSESNISRPNNPCDGKNSHASALGGNYPTLLPFQRRRDDEDKWGCARDYSNKVLVVIPSLDFNGVELAHLSKNVCVYEERQLYNLLLLDNSQVRVVFLTSKEVSKRVVRYYLNLRGDGGRTDMYDQLSRLYMLSSLGNSSSLSNKVLSRPAMINLIRELVTMTSKTRCHHNYDVFFPTPPPSAGLAVSTGSANADRLSKALGLRLLEASHQHQYWGTKQGSREMFQLCGIRVPPGTPDALLGDYDDLLTRGTFTGGSSTCGWTEHQKYIRTARALSIGLARQILVAGVRPKLWMVKLNMGFSGKGNAKLSLQEIQSKSYDNISEDDVQRRVDAMASDIELSLPGMKFEDPMISWEGSPSFQGFENQIACLGVIAEAFLEGDVQSSPSVQAFVDPTDCEKQDAVHILSTHEQILKGQVYQGCKNPALKAYRCDLVQCGKKVGNELAARGVAGHFSVDFLALRDYNFGDESWELNAVEINLRQGGTTHPYHTMDLLVEGNTRTDGIYYTKCGQPRCYVATDAFQSPSLVGMQAQTFLDAIEADDSEARSFRWNQSNQTGVVFHLFGFLESEGRIGFTAIAPSVDAAQHLYDETIRYLEIM